MTVQTTSRIDASARSDASATDGLRGLPREVADAFEALMAALLGGGDTRGLLGAAADEELARLVRDGEAQGERYATASLDDALQGFGDSLRASAESAVREELQRAVSRAWPGAGGPADVLGAAAADADAGEEAGEAGAALPRPGAGTPEGVGEDASSAFQRFAREQAGALDADARGRTEGAEEPTQAEEARRAAEAEALLAKVVDGASASSGGTAARITPGIEPVQLAPGEPAPAALPVASPPPTAAEPVSGSAPAHAAPPSETVPLHVEWLAARGGGSARVRLHPPELGELQLTVVVRGRDVEVAVRAQEVTAGQAVLASRDQLQEGLAARDLRMDGFDVQWDDGDGPSRGGRDAGSPDGREPGDPRLPRDPGDDPAAPRPHDERPVVARAAPGAPRAQAAEAGETRDPGVDLHV